MLTPTHHTSENTTSKSSKIQSAPLWAISPTECHPMWTAASSVDLGESMNEPPHHRHKWILPPFQGSHQLTHSARRSTVLSNQGSRIQVIYMHESIRLQVPQLLLLLSIVNLVSSMQTWRRTNTYLKNKSYRSQKRQTRLILHLKITHHMVPSLVIFMQIPHSKVGIWLKEKDWALERRKTAVWKRARLSRILTKNNSARCMHSHPKYETELKELLKWAERKPFR